MRTTGISNKYILCTSYASRQLNANKFINMIRHFQPNCIPLANAPFSQIVIDDHYAHLAGLVAADFPAGQAVLGDVAKETDAILHVIKLSLAELDLSMDQIVRVEVHLANFDDFDAMDAAYRAHFNEGQYPARTSIQSSQLFGGGKVEITCQVQL